MKADLILHHFDLSPFAEKIRMVLGCKGARWRSVKIPMAMPKPDVVALTGGHRRTPMLQIGADVWCDTALIANVLDRHLPNPPLHPPEQPLAPLLAQWADWTLFWTVSNFLSQPSCLSYRFAGLSAEERAVVSADRDSFRASVPRLSAADSSANLRQYLGALEAQLARGGEFLSGPLTIADFSVAHSVGRLRGVGAPAEALIAPCTHLQRWHDRMLAFGHGHSEELSSEAAVRIAATASGHESTTFTAEPGLERGQQVGVSAADYGLESSVGTLVGLGPEEMVIERKDPRAGTVHVHFPRAGFQIAPASA